MCPDSRVIKGSSSLSGIETFDLSFSSTSNELHCLHLGVVLKAHNVLSDVLCSWNLSWNNVQSREGQAGWKIWFGQVNFGLSFSFVYSLSNFSKFNAKECRFFGLYFMTDFMTHLVTGFVSPEILQHLKNLQVILHMASVIEISTDNLDRLDTWIVSWLKSHQHIFGEKSIPFVFHQFRHFCLYAIRWGLPSVVGNIYPLEGMNGIVNRGVLGSNDTGMNAVFKVLLKSNLKAFGLKFGIQDGGPSL